MKSIRASVVATLTGLLCLTGVQGARAIQEFSPGPQIGANEGGRAANLQEATPNRVPQENVAGGGINAARIPRSTARNPTVLPAPIPRTPAAPERQLGLPPLPRGTIPSASEQRVLPPPVRIPVEPVRPLTAPSQRIEPPHPQLTPPQPLEPAMGSRPTAVPPAGLRAPPPPPVTPLQPARR
jgi:hypothetical protein